MVDRKEYEVRLVWIEPRLNGFLRTQRSATWYGRAYSEVDALHQAVTTHGPRAKELEATITEVKDAESRTQAERSPSQSQPRCR